MRERIEMKKRTESLTKGSLLVSVREHSQLSSSYKKSLVLCRTYIIFVTPKVTAVKIQIYSHQLELIELIYQSIKFKEYSSNSSMRRAGCPFVNKNPM